ncbi:MAG: mevalonate kinase [Candidatus Bathyarchaeia archaeon]
MRVKGQKSIRENLSEVTASAPAKTILFGEHFVVYGKPAIVLAIDKRAYATVTLRYDKRIHVLSKDLGASGYFENNRFLAEKGGDNVQAKLEPIMVVAKKVLNQYCGKNVGVNVEISSSIPVAAGLGSSAAVAAATAVAISKLLNIELTRENIFQIAYDAEKLIHGTPSGIDPAIATYGGAILYQKDKGSTRLEVEVDIPLVIGNTCMERSTGSLVAEVKRIHDSYRAIVEPIIKSGEEIVRIAVKALQDGNLAMLGELMNINHALLCAVGVSNESLEKLVLAARNAGALGAKLTGAGGGGCMIALAEPKNLNDVKKAIEQAGGKAFVARRTADGAKIETQG